MKALKKWLYDKEGLFIVITWWFIALVIFSIILGTSISGVSNNSKITKETAPSYVAEFIEKGKYVTPYNENIKTIGIGPSSEGHKLEIREYFYRYTKEYSSEFTVSGAGTSSATIKYDLEVIETYYLCYNYTNKNLSIELIETSTEKPYETFPASLKKTESGAIHVLWNKEDTGVEIKVGQALNFSKNEDDFVVVNGTSTNVSFYEIDNETEKEKIEYDDVNPETPVKNVIDFELIVEYKNNAKSYTQKVYSTSGLSEVETKVVNDAANFYTELIESSIGINSSAFTLLIVSAVVDSILVIGAVVGIIVLKRSKDE